MPKCPGFWGNWNGKGERVTTLPPKKKVWYWYSLKSYLNLKNDGTRKTKQRIQCTSCLRELLHVLGQQWSNKTYLQFISLVRNIPTSSPCGWLVEVAPPTRRSVGKDVMEKDGGSFWKAAIFCWPFGHDKTGKFDDRLGQPRQVALFSKQWYIDIPNRHPPWRRNQWCRNGRTWPGTRVTN